MCCSNKQSPKYKQSQPIQSYSFKKQKLQNADIIHQPFIVNENSSASSSDNQSDTKPSFLRQSAGSKQNPAGFKQTYMNIFRASYKQKESENRIIVLDFDEATKLLERQANMKTRDKIKQKLKKKRSSKADAYLPSQKKSDFDFVPIPEQEEQLITPIKQISAIHAKQWSIIESDSKFISNEQKIAICLQKQLDDIIKNYQTLKPIQSINSVGIVQSEIGQSELQKVSLCEQLPVPIISDKSKLQTIIGSCFMILESDPAPIKIKYQINLNSLVLRNSINVGFANISKLKVFGGQNRDFILKVCLKEKIKLKTAQKPKDSLSNIIYLLDNYENIYTIFASVTVRKILLQDGQSMDCSKEQQNINQTTINTTLAVTSYFLGRNSKELQLKESLKHVVREEGAVGEIVQLEGMIYKKSRHLKKWAKRYVQINGSLLSSYLPDTFEFYDEHKQKINRYKKKKAIKATTQISNIQELWTRFDFYKINTIRYLIIKTHHFDKQKIKTEFAIPIINYANIFNDKNWLYSFFSLLRI